MNTTSARYTRLSQPSRINQRVCQWNGTKSGEEAEAKVKELKKKKAKITKMEARMHHQSLRYMPALVVCLRSFRSFIVRLRELSVHT